MKRPFGVLGHYYIRLKQSEQTASSWDLKQGFLFCSLQILGS